MAKIFISENITLKFSKLLTRSLSKIIGLNKYKLKYIYNLYNTAKYKQSKLITNINHIYLKILFNNLTYNLNILKILSLLYAKKKYKIIKYTKNK